MSFFISQFTPLPVSKADLSGRVVIVTGANVGLGLEAARHLARFSPKKLIVACRNQEKGGKAVQDIIETTKVAVNIVECWELDLSRFESVRAFAQRAEKELDRLDIVIENAGIATREYRTTADSWEETIQVNCLSTFLLALLLIPLLRKTTTLSPVAPRLIILSSAIHAWTSIPAYRDQENIYRSMSDKDKFNGPERYPASKLLDTLFTRELGSRLKSSKYPEDKKISLSGVHPGLCRTELARESKSWIFYLMLKLIARTSEQGSRTLTHAAIGTDGENYKGEYLADCKVTEPSSFVRSDEGKATQAKLWTNTLEILRNVAPEVETLF